MNTLNLLFFSFLGAVSFAVIFRVPRKFFIHTVVLGVCVRIGLSFFATESQVGLVTFIVAFLIGIVSHTLARLTGSPSQAFLIPGVIFLVPGSYIYRSFASALNDKMVETLEYTFTVLSISAGISFALLLANWVMPPKKAL